jgi:hypothetical protein
MSVQKIETVKASRKDQGKCSKCGDALPAGTGYLYWYPGFRSKYKIVRCLKSECFPRPSERETSKSATILAAQEAFHDSIGGQDSPDDIEAAVQEVADAVREVADEYQEALDQWENGNEQLQEKVDTYESSASEIEGWSWDGASEPDHCDEHGSRSDWEQDEIDACKDCQEKREEWLEECRDAAREVVDNVELA